MSPLTKIFIAAVTELLGIILIVGGFIAGRRSAIGFGIIVMTLSSTHIILNMLKIKKEKETENS